jgi:ABC-2 type transport system ATP-binding protein
MPAIDLQHITATYPGNATPALSDVTLQADHETVALLGPNGSGKTTLMRVLTGLHRPQSGTVVSPTDRASLSVVFQTPAVDDLLTVRENLILAAALHGHRKPAASQRIDALTPRLDLDDILSTRCARLSGGQRRRADLARALMPSPKVLILDEPTTGLDIDARARFWQTLDAIRQEEQLTVLVATHLAEEAERCDRAVLLKQGTLIAQGTPTQLRAPLGERSARVDLRPGHDAQPIRDWLAQTDTQTNPQARWGSAGAIIPDATASLLDTCPMDHATIRVSAPTLEDAYLWHTADHAPQPSEAHP